MFVLYHIFWLCRLTLLVRACARSFRVCEHGSIKRHRWYCVDMWSRWITSIHWTLEYFVPNKSRMWVYVLWQLFITILYVFCTYHSVCIPSDGIGHRARIASINFLSTWLPSEYYDMCVPSMLVGCDHSMKVWIIQKFQYFVRFVAFTKFKQSLFIQA